MICITENGIGTLLEFEPSLEIPITAMETYISMGFFIKQTSYSYLPKQIGISNPSIEIDFQYIENSSICEHVKIGLKTANFNRIS